MFCHKCSHWNIISCSISFCHLSLYHTSIWFDVGHIAQYWSTTINIGPTIMGHIILLVSPPFPTNIFFHSLNYGPHNFSQTYIHSHWRIILTWVDNMTQRQLFEKLSHDNTSIVKSLNLMQTPWWTLSSTSILKPIDYIQEAHTIWEVTQREQTSILCDKKPRQFWEHWVLMWPKTLSAWHSNYYTTLLIMYVVLPWWFQIFIYNTQFMSINRLQQNW